MTNLKDLKRTALHCRQDLADVVDLYEGFQNYVDHLTRVLRGDLPMQSVNQVQTAYKLRLRDEENLFMEWHEGTESLNAAIFSLVEDPGGYVDDPDLFQDDLIAATEKFKYLIEQRERKLRQIFEEIALESSESEAETITQLEPPKKSASFVDRVKRTDEVMEVAMKWGGRIIRFVPWALTMIEKIKK